ncbi:MAG: thioredoxin [Anaerolineae bacterium]
MNSFVVEVNQANFQTAVIQRSHQVPVLVDFWAPWCGPCRMLGPVLEKLAGEFNGRFILAKLNSDQNPALSAQFNVRGIPAVKAFRNGRVVDEFVGAQPEYMVRPFIQKLTAGVQPASSNGQAAKQAPANPAERLSKARQLLKQGQGCAALSQLQAITSGVEAASAQKLLPLAQFVCEAGRGFANTGANDLDIAYRQAAGALQNRDHAAALYNLLVILNQDKQYRSGQAYKVMLGLFELLGEQDPLTQTYRQYIK